MRIAMVTGAAGGIGLATARRFAADGMRVVMADLDGAAVARALPLLAGEGHLAVEIDVTCEDSVFAAFEAAERDGAPVAVLAAFAGISGLGPQGERVSLAEMSVAAWEQVFAINVRGTFLCVREMARRRRARPVAHGRIITMSSTGGQLGGYSSLSSYCASKGAVLSFTKVAAREFAALRITVNCIAPGPIDTPMLRRALGNAQDIAPAAAALVPLARFGHPEEVAEAAAYLASEGAAFVTGSTLDVNGGMRMQ